MLSCCSSTLYRAFLHVALLVNILLAAAEEVQPFSPVIGVMSQPDWPPWNDSLIVASYVKWLESAGARVIPLMYDMPECEMTDLLGKLNGVLFPGGDVPYTAGTPYGNASIHVWRVATETNMPLWGTCQGFEQLMSYSGAEMAEVNAENLLLPLNFTAKAFEAGSLFAGWPTTLREAASKRPLTINIHHLGVTTAEFSKHLMATWDLLATGYDRNGTEFVAAAQARGKPFYAVQFHPEHNAYEFDEKYDSIDGRNEVHSAEGIELGYRMAASFVDAARLFRGFRFEKEEFMRQSIYGYSPVYAVRNFSVTFEQAYFFPAQMPKTMVDSSLPFVIV